MDLELHYQGYRDAVVLAVVGALLALYIVRIEQSEKGLFEIPIKKWRRLMNYTTRKRFDLKPDDAARMVRLAEEARARIEEMAMIFARTVGVPLTSDMVRKFSPMTESGTVRQWPTPDIEIVCTSDGQCGCFDYRFEPPYFYFPCT